MTDIVERARADVLRSGTWADTGNLILEMADEIERLRAAIAAEREACAQLCEDMQRELTDKYQGTWMSHGTDQIMGRQFAAAIRNRSEP